MRTPNQYTFLGAQGESALEGSTVVEIGIPTPPPHHSPPPPTHTPTPTPTVPTPTPHTHIHTHTHTHSTTVLVIENACSLVGLKQRREELLDLFPNLTTE